MRLRNIPRAESTIEEHEVAIKNEKQQRGKWQQIFGNEQEIHIEIGMGKGRFILNMAKEHPEINYIGIERYSSVLLRALELYDLEKYQNLKNIRFICMDAREIADVFCPGEVDRIYLNFSDPWPKARHAKRRLTSLEFLARYEKVLKPGGHLEFKTDNKALFEFSLEEIALAKNWEMVSHTFDLHHDEAMCQGNIMTEYEQKFSAKGNPIHKVIAILKNEIK